MHPPLDHFDQGCLAHRFLGSIPQISKYDLVPGPFIRSYHDRKRGMPGIRQLQLFTQRLGTECVLDP
jgi:hypothetical protein